MGLPDPCNRGHLAGLLPEQTAQTVTNGHGPWGGPYRHLLSLNEP